MNNNTDWIPVRRGWCMESHCIVCGTHLLPKQQCKQSCLERRFQMEKLVKTWLQLIALYGTTEI